MLGGGDDEATDLVGCLGAGLDRAAAGHAEHTDRLDAAIARFGFGGGVAAQRCACCGLGVDGVGLAAPPCLAVGAVDLDDLDAGGGETAGEASPVGSGSFHPYTHQRAERAHPVQQLLIAAGVGIEAGAAQQPPHGVDDRGDVGVFVGVDPAEDLGSVCCHDGDASSVSL